MRRFQSVGQYITYHNNWAEGLSRLRKIILSTELEEVIKWSAPVYMNNGKNVVALGAFKTYFGIWFFQGALLKDKSGKLISAQEGKTKAQRQWRFNSVEEIDPLLVKEYIVEAIQNQVIGKEIKPARQKPLIIPQQLQFVMKENKRLLQCFQQLSLSRQREFTDYITEAKREETKKRRIDKIIPMILELKGLYDQYKE